jgi:phosphoribosylaminoimidazole-succinocarboxamide synthase
MTSDIKIQHIHSGKVRDIYSYGDDKLLISTSDRLSAFDVILPDTIPNKGKVLNEVTEFWMKKFERIIPNHLTYIKPPQHLPFEKEGQLCVVKKLIPVKIEAIVRGYIVGSGWKDYQKNGKICGIHVPPGLKLAEQLPEIIFTPSSKAAVGDHDENISYKEMEKLIGTALAREISDKSILMYNLARQHATRKGIIIADTKFEFGLDEDGVLHLIDEVLTPDSSRFWDIEEYVVGVSPPSFDKQIVRDYLETLDWNKEPPGPELPEEIINRTASRYREIRDRLLS